MPEISLREQVAALVAQLDHETDRCPCGVCKGYRRAAKDILALITPAHEQGPQYKKALQPFAAAFPEFAYLLQSLPTHRKLTLDGSYTGLTVEHLHAAFCALDAAKGAAPPPVAIEPHFYSMSEHSEIPGQWHAERIGKDGEVYVVMFSGPDAKARCTAFIDWQKGQAAPVRGVE